MQFTLFIRTAACVCFVMSVSACQSPPKRATTSNVSKQSPFDPAQKLAGGWHNNEEGATKRFSPDPGTKLKGNLYGFWVEGGRYEITETNANQRSLKVNAETSEPSEENEYHRFSADVTFTKDGKHMTMTRHLPNHLPHEVVTYYRAP